jgi:acyl-CoA synthetase (AMP-forming)/AMP-acid ligase II
VNPGIKQLIQVAHPRTLKRLHAAGMLGPLSPIGISASLPWLVGRGPSLGIASLINGLMLGNKLAIIDDHGSISWRDLDRNANRFAHALSAAGLGGGDRVALLLRNGREFAETVLGAQKLGVVACPMNTWAKPRELQATIERAEARVIVYDARHADGIDETTTDHAVLVQVGEGETKRGSIPYLAFRDHAASSPPSPFTRDRGSAKVVIHTSGTTGLPKGAQRDASAAGLGELANLLEVVPYHRDDIVFCPAPLFHSFGLATFTFATVIGATLVLPERFDPAGSLASIAEHHATAASFVPIMMRRICDLDASVKATYDLRSLRIVLASGSAMSPQLREHATAVFGNVIYDLYGSTEAGWVAIATPSDIVERPLSVGRPVPGIEVLVLSETGERLGPGEIGEIYVRSNVIFEGYTSGDPRPVRDGSISVGDVGHLDNDGYLYIDGRADDMVVVGGENVYPIEVEEAIETIDGVDEAAVVGIADEEYGQILVAFVTGSASEEDILAHCKRELSSYKVPRRVVLVDDLPHTVTGKVVKRALAEQL